MTLFTVSVVQQIPQKTKHSDTIYRSTSNTISQAQESNLPDVLVTIKVINESQLKGLLTVELGMQNSQFR